MVPSSRIMVPQKWCLAPSLITRCNRVTGNRALAVFSSRLVGLSQERKSETPERERGHCPTFPTPTSAHSSHLCKAAGHCHPGRQLHCSCTGLCSRLPGARVTPLLTPPGADGYRPGLYWGKVVLSSFYRSVLVASRTSNSLVLSLQFQWGVDKVPAFMLPFTSQ